MVQHGRILLSTVGVVLGAMERGHVSRHQTQTVQAHKRPSDEDSNRSEPAVNFYPNNSTLRFGRQPTEKQTIDRMTVSHPGGSNAF